MKQFVKPFPIAAGLLLLLGIVLRLRQYLAGRSLWLDEAMLALNLVQRDVAGLLKPLDYDQGAPLGFLLAQKGLISLAGSSELALRLLPLLAGLATLLLFPLLLRRFSFKPLVWLAALGLVALNPALIYYSTELKQYQFDALAAVLTGLSLPQAGARPHWRRLAALGLVLPWFSHGSVFLLAGLGLTLLWQYRGDQALQMRCAAIIAGWLAGFAGLLSLSLANLLNNTYLLAYWQDFFLPLTPEAPFWLGDKVAGLFTSPTLGGLLLPGWLAVGLAAAGIWRLAHLDQRWLGMFLLPLVFALIASALRKYPFGDRMLLFSIPASLVLVASGIDEISGQINATNWGKGIGWGIALILSGVLWFGPLQTSLERWIEPVMRENMHPALQTLRAEYAEGDQLYIYYGGVPAFLYYAPRYRFGPADYQAGTFSQTMIPFETILNEIKPMRGAARAWFLFAHVYETSDVNQQEQILTMLEEWGKCKIHSRASQTSVVLYLCDLRRK